MRRTLVLWLLLFGVYAATLGLGSETGFLGAARTLADRAIRFYGGDGR